MIERKSNLNIRLSKQTPVYWGVIPLTSLKHHFKSAIHRSQSINIAVNNYLLWQI